MKILSLGYYLIWWILKSFPMSANCDSDMLPDEEKDELGIIKISKPSFYVSEPGDKETAVTYVYHSVEVVDISKVSLETMDFRVDLHLKQRWLQEESQFPSSLFSKNATSEAYITTNTENEHPVLRALWTPDAYIPNARIARVSSLQESHSSLLLFKNRTMILSARLYVVLGCQMQFHWYPMDVQHCQLILESYSYPMRKVVFLWTNISNPVLFSPDIKLLRYAVRLPLSYREGTDDRFGRDGEKVVKTILLFTFRLTEALPVVFTILNFIFFPEPKNLQIGQQLIQVFTPTFLIVALSWFSFWLGLDAVPGRVSLVVTCMLTLVTMYSGLKTEIPAVAYVKMMDIWMAGCMGFVFAAMSEFIIVKYLSWTHTQEREKEEFIKRLEGLNSHKHQKNMEKSAYPLSINMFQSERRPSASKVIRITDSRPWNLNANESFDSGDHINAKKWAFKAIVKQNEPFTYADMNGRIVAEKYQWERLDRVSRVAFPLVFMAFLFIFWPVLIFGANSQE